MESFTPSLAQVIEKGINNALADVHTAMAGIIDSYNANEQTASVRLANKRIYESYETGDPVSEPYPILNNVPIASFAGGGINITFPLNKGDNVLVIFTEDDINNFRANNKPDNEPGYLSRFTLNGAIAIPCNIANNKYSAVSSAITIGSGSEADFVSLAKKVDENFEKVKSILTTKNAVNGSPLATEVDFQLGYNPSTASERLKTE